MTHSPAFLVLAVLADHVLKLGDVLDVVAGELEKFAFRPVGDVCVGFDEAGDEGLALKVNTFSVVRNLAEHVVTVPDCGRSCRRWCIRPQPYALRPAWSGSFRCRIPFCPLFAPRGVPGTARSFFHMMTFYRSGGVEGIGGFPESGPENPLGVGGKGKRGNTFSIPQTALQPQREIHPYRRRLEALFGP